MSNKFNEVDGTVYSELILPSQLSEYLDNCQECESLGIYEEEEGITVVFNHEDYFISIDEEDDETYTNLRLQIFSKLQTMPNITEFTYVSNYDHIVLYGELQLPSNILELGITNMNGIDNISQLGNIEYLSIKYLKFSDTQFLPSTLRTISIEHSDIQNISDYDNFTQYFVSNNINYTIENLQSLISEFDEEEENEVEDEIGNEDEDEVDLEDDYNFEDADDIDERNMSFGTCSDIYIDEEKNITTHLEETDTFLFINSQPDNGVFDMFCFEKSYIQNILNDRNNNWFYECNGSIIEDSNDRAMNSFVNFPYIKIPLNMEGLNGFIPLNQIHSILASDNKVYYIYPFLLNGVQKMITHSVSWQNSYGPRSQRDFVSANHCQSGSGILIYNLKVCRDPERCVRSVL